MHFLVSIVDLADVGYTENNLCDSDNGTKRHCFIILGVTILLQPLGWWRGECVSNGSSSHHLCCWWLCTYYDYSQIPSWNKGIIQGGPEKNGTGYFLQYVDAITGIRIWGNFSREKNYTKISNFGSAQVCFLAAHFVRQCRDPANFHFSA